MTASAKVVHTRRTTDAFGIKVHNLVLEKDSGNDYVEFRVQCEIRLNPEEARQVLADLSTKTVQSLRHAEQIVTPNIDSGASAISRQAISNAFQDNLYFIEHGSVQTDGAKARS
jgi:hypothetical protein